MKAPRCQVEFYEGFCGSVPSPFYLLNKHTTVQECNATRRHDSYADWLKKKFLTVNYKLQTVNFLTFAAL